MSKRTSRRRVLAGAVAALGAAIAGCGEETVRNDSNDDYETVTPAEVPKEPADIIEAIEETTVPRVPNHDPVDAAHIAVAIDHLESIVDEGKSAIEAAAGIDDADGLKSNSRQAAGAPDDPERTLSDVRDSIPELRGRDPSFSTLVQCRRLIRRAASAAGYAGAVAETLDSRRLFEEFRAVEAAIDTFADETEYRLAEPYGSSLVNLSRAERMLPSVDERVRDVLNAEDETPTERDVFLDDGETWLEAAVYLRRHLAELRREHDDALRFRAAATDSDAPPRGAALEELLDRYLAEADSLALDTDGASDEAVDLGESSADDVRRVQLLIGRRVDGVIERTRRRRKIGKPARALVTITDWLCSFASIDEAAARALDRDDDVDPEELLDAKRGAAEAIERLAAADALSRRIGRSASGAIGSADDAIEPPGSGPLFAYFAYRAGERIADGGIERADAIISTLETRPS